MTYLLARILYLPYTQTIGYKPWSESTQCRNEGNNEHGHCSENIESAAKLEGCRTGGNNSAGLHEE